MQKKSLVSITWLALLLMLGSGSVMAITEKEDGDEPTAAVRRAGTAAVVNDEGGPVLVTGSLTYTNALFTNGVTEPLIILEDQAGFVDRDEYYILPLESQVLGQITSDFLSSPVSYSLSLPKVPNGSLRDVDNNGSDDVGVMIFSVAYWTNKFGDILLEERDLYGGGWSTAYASTRASSDVDTRLEIIGGKFIIYAPEAGQGFPSGFGADGRLFSADDPIVTVPPGYSVVDMDVEPFRFDRAARQVIDLIEPEGAAIHDFSDLGYADAFAAMVELFRKEYAYTELYELDWDALFATYSPRFAEAESDDDPQAYALAMRDFLWEIPDGHVGMPFGLISELFHQETDGGLGISLTELDDGQIIVSYVLEGSPAAQAGMQLGTEILEWDGGSIEAALDREFVWAHQTLSTPHTLRLQQLRYITRFPLETQVDITFRNPDSGEAQSVTLQQIDDFYFDPRAVDRFILPPEALRYDGEVAVVVAPGCFSACEFFSYNMTINERAAVIAHYPTGGLGGGVDDFLMPENMTIRFTVSRAVDPDYNIHIEAQGVQPTVRVPVTHESVFSQKDFLLDAAEDYLTEAILGEKIEGGELALGLGSTEVQANGIVGPNQRVHYRVTLPAKRVVSIYLRGLDDSVDMVLGVYEETGLHLLFENDDASSDIRSSALTDLDVGDVPLVLVLEVRVKDTDQPQTFSLTIQDALEERDDSESE